MIDNFSNNQLDPEDLPSVADLDFQLLSPHYVKVAVIQLLLAMLLPLLMVSAMLTIISIGKEAEQAFTLTATGLAFIGLLLAMFAVSAIWVCIKEARHKAYCLREHDLIFRHGLFFRKRVVQPLLRVQHVEVSQNPLEARWGLATLKLFSAGGFRYTFAIPGLEKPLAERIHQLVVSYQETHHE